MMANDVDEMTTERNKTSERKRERERDTKRNTRETNEIYVQTFIFILFIELGGFADATERGSGQSYDSYGIKMCVCVCAS